MPYTPSYSNVYDLIKSAVTDYAGFACVRADEISEPNRITDDIRAHIGQARFLIAEITELNANVYYELGVGHALDKSTILLLQEGHHAPFDIKDIRYLEYSSDLSALRMKLIEYMKGCLISMPKTWNKQLSTDGPDVRIVDVEAPASGAVGHPIQISAKAKNFGADARQAYLTLSFPSGVSAATAIGSDIKTKCGQKGDSWKAGEVILGYPIAEGFIFAPNEREGWKARATPLCYRGSASRSPRVDSILRLVQRSSRRSGLRARSSDGSAS